ncbi:phosphotyrosine-specific ptp2-like protein [Paecilomyces lecythidis]|uniref:protein-tyrosine-phosphatase n=1 Tax=Paecilomyces lecythidis TaxID=3004212 RepID=A0ABR3WRA6_9EURO
MSSVATSSRPSPSSPWSPGPQVHPHASVSTTPGGLPARTPGAVVPLPSPFLNTGSCSTQQAAVSRTSSPNYFCIEVENSSNPPGSNPGPYTKRNWEAFLQPPSTPAPRVQMPISNPALGDYLGATKFELKPLNGRGGGDEVGPTGETNPLSESQHANDYFGSAQNAHLSGGTSNNSSSQDSSASRPAENGQAPSRGSGFFQLGSMNPPPTTFQPPSFAHLSSPRIPQKIQDRTNSLDPSSIGRSISESGFRVTKRAETLPASFEHGNARLITLENLAEIMSHPDGTLLLDVRPFPHFAQGHIKEALNLCVPTTLLKRPSFNTRKLEDTFTDESHKQKFSAWKECSRIIVYDANTSKMQDAGPLLNVLRKFNADGWVGEALILAGGFAAFSNRFPDLVDGQQQKAPGRKTEKPFAMNLNLPSIAPVVGGCALPESSSAANPFFGNIRQNMDLLGGVGQMTVKLPDSLTENKRSQLPSWLRDASDVRDKGHAVSERFLDIEKRELYRMREALSSKVSYGSAPELPTEGFRVAGIEKGSKNRYNDIYPFDHSRVRLQNVPSGECDYVNANHVKAEYTNKNYIATQAPVPDTFNDFWRVVWEQDVRVIVALTAEVERGHVKCHPYWHSGDYGPLKLKTLAEKRISVDSESLDPEVSYTTPTLNPNETGDYLSCGQSTRAVEAPESTGKDPYIIVRHFTLSHSAFPFQPLREITQLQYPYWPDFGTTSQPAHLLKLVEKTNKITRSISNNPSPRDAEPAGRRPVLVHCSAGCGRTGTFCTVDSVLDMLKRQQAESRAPGGAEQPNPGGNRWIYSDDVDLVAKTVEDFRTQRPSMVQNLSQFVLCYESILEWFVSQMGDDGRSSNPRR